MAFSKVIGNIYKYITDERRVKKIRKVDSVIRKIGGPLYTKTLGQLKYKLRYEKVTRMECNPEEEALFENLCWGFEKENQRFLSPLVSVIVPNYNHDRFLKERLESIYNQTYPNIEVILLDDCSTDDSREILDYYAQNYSDNTTVLYNEVNGGCVFQQWNKGLEVAKGQLIWIAESDDYCELDFLEKMTALFRYDSVLLAFARSVFVQEGEKIWSTEEYLHDLPYLRWDKPFYMSANDLVQKGFAIHNIIPNVSSAVFRNTGMIPEEIQSICNGMHLSGDWVFYLSMIKGSVVAYTNDTTNYYRIHPHSTSLKIQKTEDYYKEFEQVSCFVARNYKVDNSIFEIILKNLEKHHEMQKDKIDGFRVEDYYSVEKILAEKDKRQPNIVMACYALRSGGGETFPIYLANEMKRQGLTVTLMNFDLEPTEDRIKDIVSEAMPIVTIKHTDDIWSVLHHLGADVVHSHHASVDYALALWIESNPDLAKHIITLHGMYESIAKEDCMRVINATWKSCYKYAYVADKNLNCFQESGLYSKVRFVKLPNGLPKVEVKEMNRIDLKIEPDDFAYVLASRGMPEKGWKEAIEATTLANKTSRRKIHLVILGDGEERERLENSAPDYVHFLGTVSNVRDYFNMGDAGLLPSRFKGESYPLVIIECLMTGKPVVATAIAEVPNQIIDENGNAAGLLIPISDWKFSVEQLAETMKKMANDDSLYQQLKHNTALISGKFNVEKIAMKYLEIYNEAIRVESL